VGEGVSTVAVGDRVVINGTISTDPLDPLVLAGKDNLAKGTVILGEDIRGTYAEYVVVPQQNVLKLPDTFQFEEAAAASLVFLTAWHSLVTRGNLRPGETVLVVGAGGGVNTASIQIAKQVGAEVIVLGSNANKCERARYLGANQTINREEEPDWSRAVYALTDKRGVDVVVDNVGAATWGSSIRSLTRGGRLLTVGGTSGYSADVPVNIIFRKHLSIIGSTMGTHEDFRTVMGMIFSGKLQSIVDRVFPLDQVRAAHQYLEAGDFFGKVVLVP
jgi:NADPH:quinone reductase-like Zn-dependent oxidoreductase